jgi:hypothetical protein
MNIKKTGVLSYGGSPTISLSDEVIANFPGSVFQALSFCCTPIELLSNDGNDSVIGRGSGFFYLWEGNPLLVTNWHVVSGRNVFTKQLLSANGYIPAKLRYFGLQLNQVGNEIRFARTEWVISLPEDAQSLLAEPPSIDGAEIDIWAAPVVQGSVIEKNSGRKGFQGSENLSSFVNDHVAKNISSQVGEDCLILGYPLSNYDGLKPPVWKTASLASEPGIPLGGLPLFLVDGHTTSSMSGAPIFRRLTTGIAQNPITKVFSEQAQFAFLGVYAGRLQSADLENTGLGYGWYGSLIGKVAKYYGYSVNSLIPGSLEENGFELKVHT